MRQKFCLKSCQYQRKPEPQWSENLKEVYVRNCYKIHSKIHINFDELMNFVFWWSCIKKGSQSPGLTLFFVFIVNLIKLEDARMLLEESALKPERGEAWQRWFISLLCQPSYTLGRALQPAYTSYLSFISLFYSESSLKWQRLLKFNRTVYFVQK